MSTIEIGDKFRDDVANLLRIGGYNVKTEILYGSKKVDIVFEEYRFGKLRKYAVEAKNYSAALNFSDLSNIYGGYAQLLVTKEIDELIVVSQHKITSAAANSFIEKMPNFSHQTINEFQESILGFSHYISSLVHKHEQEGLEEYFIPPQTTDGIEIQYLINSWIHNNDYSPVAIIAGYGMGKTSFAHHIAYLLARKFAAGENTRLPILISLGRISREQGLEGLIGTTLTADSPSVQNYSFPIFDHLNRMGRFLIILDGFDEMKHMMTEGEFKSTFDELNRLITGESKVLLLGRPTAFLSENEYAYVLRGTRRIGNQMHQAPGAPRYSEVRLSPFSPSQVRSFVGGYIKHLLKSNKIDIKDGDFLERRRLELESKDHEDIISRPVHARMLAELATDPQFEIRDLNRHQLYDHFVDHLIDREIKKPGRGNILKRQDRRSFACDLAWHLWQYSSTSTSGCRMDELPDNLFSPYTPKNEDENAIRRALLSGSFLDEKSGGTYYFAHRSFQEFLVAEYIWSNITDSSSDAYQIVRKFDHALTEDVFKFITERDDSNFFRSLISQLSRCSAKISIKTLGIMSNSSSMRRICAGKSQSFFTEWDAAILLVYGLANRKDDFEIQAICKYVGDKCKQKPKVIMKTLGTLIAICSYMKIGFDLFSPGLVAIMFARAEQDIDNLSKNSEKLNGSEDLQDLIFDTVTSEIDKNSKIIMTLDVGALISSIKDYHITNYQHIENETGIIYREEFSIFFNTIDQTSHSRVRNFYKKDALAADNIRKQGRK